MTTRVNQPVISVFGSHSPQPGSPVYEQARELGYRLADAGFSVATGGYEGTMAAVSRGVSEAYGHSIGVTSSTVELSRGAKLNRWVEEEIRYDTLQERLFHLVTNNVGMVVLEGGIGTLSELSLAWSLIQVKEMKQRPMILLGELWKDFLKVFIRREYVPKQTALLVELLNTPEEVVALFMSNIPSGAVEEP